MRTSRYLPTTNKETNEQTHTKHYWKIGLSIRVWDNKDPPRSHLSNTSWFQAQEEEEGRTWVLQPNPGGGGKHC